MMLAASVRPGAPTMSPSMAAASTLRLVTRMVCPLRHPAREVATARPRAEWHRLVHTMLGAGCDVNGQPKKTHVCVAHSPHDALSLWPRFLFLFGPPHPTLLHQGGGLV